MLIQTRGLVKSVSIGVEKAAIFCYFCVNFAGPFYLSYISPLAQLVCAIGSAFILFCFNRREFAHPINCCQPLILLTVVSFPVYEYISGGYSEVTSTVLGVHMVFSAATVAAALLPGISLRQRKRVLFVSRDGSQWVALICWVALIVSLVFLARVFLTGAQSKREVIQTAGHLAALPSYMLITVPACCLVIELRRLARCSAEGKSLGFPSATTIASGVLLLLGLLVLGERDLLFRALVVVAIFNFDFLASYRHWYGPVVAVGILIVAPLSQGLKSAGLTQSSQAREVIASNYRDVEKVLSQEFSTSGRNLYYLVLHNERGHGFYFYVNGIARTLYLSDSGNAVRWFHEVFRPSKGIGGSSGWGFTLSGESYVSFGFVGVLAFGVLYGVVLQCLFWRRLCSEYAYVWYALAVYGFVYVQRGDVANFFAFVVKIPLLVCLVIYCASRTAGVQR